MSIRTACLALSLLLTGWRLPQARAEQAQARVPGYRTETNIPYRSGANLDGYAKECRRLDMELLGRYEENAYLWRMMKEVGHPGTELYELEGFNHGGTDGWGFRHPQFSATRTEPSPCLSVQRVQGRVRTL